MKKILILGPTINNNEICGGQITHIKYLLQAFSCSNCWDVTDFQSSLGLFNQESLFSKCYRFLIVLYKIFNTCKLYDLVHINSTFDNRSFLRDCLIALVLKIRRVPFVFQFHGGKLGNVTLVNSQVFKFFVSNIFFTAREILVLTPIQQSQFEGVFGIEPLLIPNFLPYEPAFFKKKLVTKHINLLFLGRIDSKKGIYELISSLKYFVDKPVKFHLTIAGDGPDRQNVERMVIDYKLSKYITFLGHIENEVKISAYHSSDYFILPSYEEAFPYSILESLSYSVPVLATDVGAITSVVENGVNGFIIDLPTSACIIKCLKVVLLSRSSYPEMSERSFESSLSYSLTAMNNSFSNIWRKALL
ncbi:MAG: hypothetical protein OFPII_25730 [Osedax symbiont Rs1]|nr:MAG: hypothetical protein OFPII_25730 [Osedax symbiont Rs1]